MIINALEATEENGTIRVWLKNDSHSVTFGVWNAQVIPPNVALRVFQRNFSTKDEVGRGIGTYSMKLFGVTEFAARFPNMICGVLTLLSLYRIGNKVAGQRFGVLWVIAFATAVLPFFYYKSGIIDPWLNLFILLGFTYFIYYLDPDSNRRRYFKLVLSALFFGLAILTKGPVPVLVFALSFFIFLLVKKK